MSVEFDEDFFWMISRLKNFERNNLTIWLEILQKYDGKNWSSSRTAIMRELVEANYTNVKDFQETNEDLLDKRFQSHVSFMFALGLGYQDQNGIFVLSPIVRAYAGRKDLEDFLLQQMLRWQMPNGSIRVREKLEKWVHDTRCVLPFVLTMRLLLELFNHAEVEAYLTLDETIKVLMPLKGNDVDMTSLAESIITRRQSGEVLRLSQREQGRAKEDLKILFSYFEATGLCYVPRATVAKVGGQTVQISDALALSLDRVDKVRRLMEKKYTVFDFSKFNVQNDLQVAKVAWFEYYGSIPESWERVMIDSPMKTEGDEPLPMPSPEDVESAIAEIRKKLMVEDTVIRQIIANLIAGKSILLAGPIATGKTHLATMLSTTVWAKFENGYRSEITTATSEWTSQEVVGGIYPKVNENSGVVYEVQRGCVTDTVSQNWAKTGNTFKRSPSTHEGISYRGTWLVIDEFNRANIDRAFGELFTALEYKRLKFPTTRPDFRFEEIPIPKDYRIIATINTFDKHFLFKLSDALKRRFAFVELLPPPREKSEEEKYYVVSRSLDDLPIIPELAKKIVLKANRTIDRDNTDADFLKLLDSAYDMFAFIRLSKNLGTGVLNSMFSLVLVNSAMGGTIEVGLDNAFKANVIPQLENLPMWSLESIEAFCCGNIVDMLKQKKATETDFIHYQQEFERLLTFLGKDEITRRLERYRKDEMKDSDWSSYDPWFGKYRPKLNQFQQSLRDLIRETKTL